MTRRQDCYQHRELRARFSGNELRSIKTESNCPYVNDCLKFNINNPELCNIVYPGFLDCDEYVRINNIIEDKTLDSKLIIGIEEMGDKGKLKTN